MNTIYVLIMIASFGNSIPSVATQEFLSSDSCQKARIEFLKLKQTKDAVCVQK